MNGEIDEGLVVSHEITQTALSQVYVFLVFLGAFVASWTFAFLDVQEHLLHGLLVHAVQQSADVLVIGNSLNVGKWEMPDSHDDEIPDDSPELCVPEPAEAFVVEHKLQEVFEDGERGWCVG
jgi:hypothetical protein